jgi:16S rRNA (guanine527-N7)-methyltransferase
MPELPDSGLPESELLVVLQGLRERGALGEASLPDAVRHAEAFLAALPPSTRRVIDLGSGGGLPGLVLAVRLPHAELVLTDRRERRMDLLRMACTRLGIGARVSVITGDVVQLGKRADLAGTFDAVTARSFGEPAVVLRCARPFLAPGGVVVVSEPPDLANRPPEDPAVAARWPTAMLASLGLVLSAELHPSVRRIEQVDPPAG